MRVDRQRPVMPNCDDSPSKKVWLEHGWRERSVAAERLYDLVFDPHETGNLVDDLASVDVLADMRALPERGITIQSVEIRDIIIPKELEDAARFRGRAAIKR